MRPPPPRSAAEFNRRPDGNNSEFNLQAPAHTSAGQAQQAKQGAHAELPKTECTAAIRGKSVESA